MHVLRDDDLIVECGTDAEVLAAEQAARLDGVLVISITTDEPTVAVPRSLVQRILEQRQRVDTDITHAQRDATADALEVAIAAGG